MFDVLTIAALADELASRLVGGRIQRILQIDDATIGLEVYAEHQRSILVASADSQNPRLYLSTQRLSADPDRVTPLLLLLRKYARGGRVAAVQQPPLERIMRLSIAKPFYLDNRRQRDDVPTEDEEEAPSELVYTHLIVELMGRRSNIILTDDEGRILDAIKRVTPEMSRVRPILPGRPYVPPPPREDAVDPRHLTPSALHDLLRPAPQDEELAPLLVRHLAGFSPQMAREAVYRATGAADAPVRAVASRDGAAALAEAVASVLAPLETGNWTPGVYVAEGRAVAFSAIPLDHLAGAEVERFPTMSPAIERWLALAGAPQPVAQAQRRDKLVAQIRSARERAAARLRSLEEERARGEEGERWRTMGELIYAYLASIQPGQTELVVDDLTIPLDPARSPSENAQAYFERYRKARSATENLPELIEATRTELAYLEQLETLAGFAEGMEQVEQVRQEWESYRDQRPDASTGKRRQSEPKRPKPLRTARGDLIYIGHNGRQNDLITFDIAGPDDTWLHARGLPGAHVIVRWAGPEDEEVLLQAAALAAYFSAGRNATSVEVDATARRYVRKIKGAGPGMVTYRNERTLNVRPTAPADLGLA
ncbi:NFACT family protein [Sphaerobacter sp.]|uniref:Rqc2 family fibronectin-binding protein n=1 Tax=Sphaerobacter sp. TaxID=2099654 RepID=UPI001D7E3007|nr:NFACT family protein [Sphaerobacter sp.]MBX5444995.1 NFACT family protein [Sphaerobacter sp.]